jgi:BASS family bile acid:Na+ symporter
VTPTIITTLLLPIAVGVIMFGLGLALAPSDFARVVRYPRAVVVGLLIQTVVMVPVAFCLTQWFALPAGLAIGLMLLAAAPGGPTATIFSHLAEGDVALNVTLTAINSVVAMAWLPLVLTWSLEHFLGAGQYVPPPTQKLVEVATVIVFPVFIGMVVRAVAPRFAQSAVRPVRVGSVLVLAGLVAIAFVGYREVVVQQFGAVGLACLVFNLISMTVGYVVPRAVRLPPPQATAIALEIGIHNAALAIFVALTVLQDPVAPVPAAVYSLVMFATAGGATLWLRRRHLAGPADSRRIIATSQDTR